MSVPAVAAEELKRRRDTFLHGDSGEGLRRGPPRCKIKEEPEAVITTKCPLLPELENVLQPFQYPENKAIFLEYALHVHVFLYIQQNIYRLYHSELQVLFLYVLYIIPM